uniref:Ubiquitin-like domain-containing protein n=1 Tax=Caenorhabditis tropicalis TaxID=1561998 RepID=A0A1I7TGL6_9PELO
MNSLGLTITRIANVQNEQAKVLKEVEAIRNDVQTMKRDSDNMDALKRTENHPSSQKITFYLLFNDRKDVFEYLPTDTIADVKREIAIRMEVPVHQQMIYFKSEFQPKPNYNMLFR